MVFFFLSCRSDEKNVKVAPGLVHILAEAKVEVPEFLTCYGGSGGGGSFAFGGTDIRGGGGAANYEEEW
jgi:hypothetical protein